MTKKSVIDWMYTIYGKHGVAPGISGFSREFYKHFQKELIPFIMCYIEETEKLGILSQNQRVGVITLLPKGDKDKTKIKNWRPITLLPTLYEATLVCGNNVGQNFFDAICNYS